MHKLAKRFFSTKIYEAEWLNPTAFIGPVPPMLTAFIKIISNKSRADKLGIRLPHVLMTGPPGTGKTHFVRHLAAKSQMTGKSISAAEIFSDKYVGGPVRCLDALFTFENTDSQTPKYIFIDEIDCFSKRGGGGSASSYYEGGLTHLLTKMDGLDSKSDIIVIGATNLPYALDKALIRPGRFEHIIEFGLPDETTRVAILQFFASGIRRAEIDWEVVAKSADGFTAAELRAVTRSAALRAFYNGKDYVVLEDCLGAVQDIFKNRDKSTANFCV